MSWFLFLQWAGALGLCLFLVIVLLVAHQDWKEHEEMRRFENMRDALKPPNHPWRVDDE